IYIIDYLVVYNVFLFKFRSHNGYLHSFPTRRSSDLGLGIDADIGLRAGFPPQIRIRGAEGHASVGDGLVGTKRIVLPAADDCRKAVVADTVIAVLAPAGAQLQEVELADIPEVLLADHPGGGEVREVAEAIVLAEARRAVCPEGGGGQVLSGVAVVDFAEEREQR